VGFFLFSLTIRITGPGVDLKERCEPVRLFRLRLKHLLSGVGDIRSNERLEPTVGHPFSIKNRSRWIHQRSD